MNFLTADRLAAPHDVIGEFVALAVEQAPIVGCPDQRRRERRRQAADQHRAPARRAERIGQGVAATVVSDLT